MTRFGMIALAALALAACGRNPVADSEPAPEAAEQVGEATTLPSALPAPSEATPRYVGLWALAQSDCADPPWRFEADGISTKGEVGCDFQNVQMTPTGYTIAAQCTAEAPPEPYQLQISFAESARAMMLTGGPWEGESRGLVYCAPLPGR